ncbi:hypothetical protein [Mesorhizobium sp. M7A.F.Ca.US.008.03.1.1]|uniref:hypothetical protein n=1 Tax=Mesorhizobium sp. M7A.F.Ca.US.008.03.1.1 TaxID=2496742 RepID=UPI000FCB6ABA|nr:hypothetical protein [Mesorhizobium sp. M7A.F.Ca.US.008.03.1.1]RUW62773.1 hypothetical protein EOA16_06765 [Mesorhizobium sp. M7A.F.Ca.US.008.03.1.1]
MKFFLFTWRALQSWWFDTVSGAGLRLSNLSEIIRWSFIANFGQSPAVRLTILVPFIGYLIIFNQSLQSYVGLVFDKIEYVSIPQSSSGAHATLRFYNLYFGLLFLGIGSFLYTIFAPRQIKQHPLVADYVRYMDSIATENLTRASLDNLLEMFVRSNDDEQRHPMFGVPSLSFPSEISSLTHHFIRSVFLKSEWARKPPEPEPDDKNQQDEFQEDEAHLGDLYTGSGYLLTNVIVDRMYANRRFDLYFVDSMFTSALQNSRDVFVLEHKALDCSNFLGRAVVSAFYALGFSILFIPTARITFAIVKALYLSEAA